MGEALRQEIPEEAKVIPEYYQICDVRKPVKQYVEDKLQGLLQ
jgi:hypothetical protein